MTDERVSPRTGDILSRPVFVVGVPRSGTTLLYSILARLPAFGGQAAWSEETAIFADYGAYLQRAYSCGYPEWRSYFRGDEERFRRFRSESYRSFFRHATEARGARRVLEKTPNHLLHIDAIRAEFPDAQFLHAVRHPVDVYASMKQRSAITPHGKDIWLHATPAEFADTYCTGIAASFAADADSSMTVRYESLTKDPEREVRRVCAFIGERFFPGCLGGERPRREVRRFPYQSSVPVPNADVWREVLTPEVVRDLQVRCAPAMATIGYEPYAI